MDTTAGEKVHCEKKWASFYMVTGSNGNKGMTKVARTIKVFVSFERSPKAYRLYSPSLPIIWRSELHVVIIAAAIWRQLTRFYCKSRVPPAPEH